MKTKFNTTFLVKAMILIIIAFLIFGSIYKSEILKIDKSTSLSYYTKKNVVFIFETNQNLYVITTSRYTNNQYQVINYQYANNTLITIIEK